MSSQLLLPVAVFASTHVGVTLIGAPFAGQLAVVAGVAAVGWSARASGLDRPSLGLARPRSAAWLLRWTAVAVVVGYVAAVSAMLLATQGLGWAPMQASRFAGVAGSLPMLLGMLLVSWTTAAFGEELLFRGFVQSRLQALFGERRFAGLLAAVLQALLFGLCHAYQGPTGVLVTGALGLMFGLVMLRTRSLWPLVIAHGLIDSISMLALYAGAGVAGQ